MFDFLNKVKNRVRQLLPKRKKEITFRKKESKLNNEDNYEGIVNRTFSNNKNEIQQIIESHIDYTAYQNVDDLILKSEKELKNLFNRESCYNWNDHVKKLFKNWLLASDFFAQIYLDPNENYLYYSKNRIFVDFSSLSPSKQIGDVMMYAKNEHRVLTKEYVIHLVALYFLQLYKNIASLDNIYSYLIALIPMEKYFEWYKIEDSVTVFFKRVNEQFKEFGIEEINQKELLKIFEKSKQYEYLKKTFGEFEKSFDVYKRYEESRENVQISTSSLDKVQPNVSMKQNESLEEEIIRILKNNEGKIRKILLDSLTDEQYMYLEIPIFEKCKDKIKALFVGTRISWTDKNEDIIEKQFRKLSAFIDFDSEQKSNLKALNVDRLLLDWRKSNKELLKSIIDFSIDNNFPLNIFCARIKLAEMYLSHRRNNKSKAKEDERDLYKNLMLFISNEELKSWLIMVNYSITDFFAKIKKRFERFSVIVNDETTFRLGVMDSKFFFTQREKDLNFKENYNAYINSTLNNQFLSKDAEWIIEEIARIVEKKSSTLELLLKDSTNEENIETLIIKHQNEFKKLFVGSIFDWTEQVKCYFIQVLKETTIYKNTFELTNNYENNLVYFISNKIKIDFKEEKNIQSIPNYVKYILQYAEYVNRPLDQLHALILVARYYLDEYKNKASTLDIYIFLLSLMTSNYYVDWAKKDNDIEDIIKQFYYFGVESIDKKILLEALKYIQYNSQSKISAKENINEKIISVLKSNEGKIRKILHESLTDPLYMYLDMSIFDKCKDKIKTLFIGTRIEWTKENEKLIEENFRKLSVFIEFHSEQKNNIKALKIDDIPKNWGDTIRELVKNMIDYSIDNNLPLSTFSARIKLAEMYFKKYKNPASKTKEMERKLYKNLVLFISTEEMKSWLIMLNYNIADFFTKIKKRFEQFSVIVNDETTFRLGVMDSKFFFTQREKNPRFKKEYGDYIYSFLQSKDPISLSNAQWLYEEIARIIEKYPSTIEIMLKKCTNEKNIENQINNYQKVIKKIFVNSVFDWSKQLKSSFILALKITNPYKNVFGTFNDFEDNLAYFISNKIKLDFREEKEKILKTVLDYAKLMNRPLDEEHAYILIARYCLDDLENERSTLDIYVFLLSLIPSQKIEKWENECNGDKNRFFRFLVDQFQLFNIKKVDKSVLRLALKKREHCNTLQSSSIDRGLLKALEKENNDLEEKIVKVLNNNEDKIRKILFESLTDQQYLHLDTWVFDKYIEEIKNLFVGAEIPWTDENEVIIKEYFKKLKVFTDFDNEQRNNLKKLEETTTPEISTENIEPTTIQMDSQPQDEKDPLDCFMQVLEKKSFKSKKENEIIEALFDIEKELKNVEDCLSDYHSNEVRGTRVIEDDEINDLMY